VNSITLTILGRAELINASPLDVAGPVAQRRQVGKKRPLEGAICFNARPNKRWRLSSVFSKPVLQGGVKFAIFDIVTARHYLDKFIDVQERQVVLQFGAFAIGREGDPGRRGW
jgi:hypothetical protein